MTAAQGTEISISRVPGGKRQCKAVARRRVTHPSAVVYVEDEASVMVCSVLFAQMSWQKIPSLFIYKKPAQQACNSAWTPDRPLGQTVFIHCQNKCFCSLCTKITGLHCYFVNEGKNLFHRHTQDNAT